MSKVFPEFDDKKHVITVKNVPSWLDATCYIEVRHGRTFAVSRTRVRRWRLWRDWWRRHPTLTSAAQNTVLVLSIPVIAFPAAVLVERAGWNWTLIALFGFLAWGFLMGWMMRRVF